MEIRTLSDTLAVLDADTLVDTLTKRFVEAEINTVSNIFSKVEGVTLVEILSGWLVKVDIVKITKRLF